MDGESRNLQNDYFNEARKSRSNVTVFLNNGKKLTGRIKSFDKFTLMLEGHQGDLFIFKHAISTIATARWSSEGAGDAERRPAPAGPRPAGREDP